MVFSLELFKKKNIALCNSFRMLNSIDKARFSAMKKQWEEDGGLKYVDALNVIKQRTSIDYFNNIEITQSRAIDYSKHIFPAYEFLIADILFDDWMSIMDPHQKGKRDHSVHQPLTAYVVSELLGGGKSSEALHVNNDESLLSLCAKKFLKEPKMNYINKYQKSLHPEEINIINEYSELKWAESLFFEAAIMAALFHDIGYPWQYVHKVCAGIRYANNGISAGLSFSRQEIYDQIKDRLLIYPFYGYSDSIKNHQTSTMYQDVLCNIESAFNNTHGFPGALAFQYLNDVIRQFPINPKYSDSNFRFIQDWAAVGIMMHDMVWEYYGKDGYIVGQCPKNPQYRLSFNKDPLSCLIAIADILEEFGRPNSGFKAYKKRVTTRFKKLCNSTELFIANKTMTIVYHYSDAVGLPQYREKRQKEIDRYFNPECGFVDLSAIGIDAVECRVEADNA